MKNRKRWSLASFISAVLIIFDSWTFCIVSCTIQISSKDGMERRSGVLTVVAKSFTCEGKHDGVYTDASTNCTFYHRCIKGVPLTYQCQGGSSYDATTGQCSVKLSETCIEKPTSPLSATCFQKPDGIYVDYESKCHNYYRCESSTKIDFTCGQHMIFEMRSLSCVASNLTTCHVPSCSGKDEGYYPVPDSDAKLYYSCGPQGISSVLSCPLEKRFDPMLSACRTLPFTSTLHLDCSGKADGVYRDATRFCRHTYFCQSEQVASILSCPQGFVFDVAANRCRDAHHFKCSPEMTDELFSPSCENKIDGYYPEFASGCRSFFYCLEGKRLFNITCPPGQLFNPQLETCNDASSVLCSATSLSASYHFCWGKLDGYYPNPITGCKSYFYCQEGKISSEITCPVGKVFNLTVEDCTSYANTSTDVLCSNILLMEDCNGKQDGYHPYYSVGCQKYFYCGAGRKLLEFQCPKGQLFHPIKRQCMNASRVTCEQNSFSPECSAKEDGYYPNSISGCRTFYYCRNGVKMNELSCPSRQIFDVKAQACADEESTSCQSVIDCSSDGFYGDYGDSCQTYHLCGGGRKLSELHCPFGRAFDVTTRACVAESLAVCVPSHLNHSDCYNKLDGFFALSSAENQFYQCQNGRMAAAFQCPLGATFNNAQGQCLTNNASFDCVGNFCCHGLPNGFYVPDVFKVQQLRSSFYSCVNNHLTVHKCPRNLTWSWETRSCDDFGSINQNTVVSSEWDKECSDVENGIYANVVSNCTTFVVCLEKKVATFGLCWFGYVFDQRKGLCELKGDDPLSTNVKDHSHSEEDATVSTFPANILTDSASTFSSFLQEKPVTVHNKYKALFTKDVNRPALFRSGLSAKATPRSDYLEYPSYSFFKGITTESFSEPSTVPISMPVNKYFLGDRDCKGKMNGVFPDFTSGCRQFFICFREVKMLYTCSANRLFNPETNTCDDAQDVLCQPKSFVETHGSTNDIRRFHQSAEDFENFHRPELSGSHYNDKFSCLPYEMGFFPEYASGCRDFYVCFRGIQKIYSCPDGLLFSPRTKSCDSPANVNCTSDHDTGTDIKSPFPIASPNVSKTQLSVVTPNCNTTEVVVDKESNCQNYTMCQDGRERTFTCPDGMRYHANSSRCNLAENVPCMKSSSAFSTSSKFPPIKELTTEQTSTSTSTTRPVSFLSHARPLPTLSEGRAAYTDSHPLVITESSISHPFDCSKRVDGFYPDYVRQCHVFYRCLRGRKLSYYCKVGQLFNPATQLCDLEDNVRCL